VLCYTFNAESVRDGVNKRSKLLPPQYDHREQNGGGCPERTIAVGDRKQGYVGVEGETHGSDYQHRFRSRKVQIPEVDSKGNAEKEESELQHNGQHNGQRLHDHVHPAPPKSCDFGMEFLPSIGDTPQPRDLSTVHDPLFPQYRNRGHE